MSMANLAKRKTPKPRYTGTVVCGECEAEYSPGKWMRGYDAGPRGSTAGIEFVCTSRVPDGVCPICLTPAEKVNV